MAIRAAMMGPMGRRQMMSSQMSLDWQNLWMVGSVVLMWDLTVGDCLGDRNEKLK